MNLNIGIERGQANQIGRQIRFDFEIFSKDLSYEPNFERFHFSTTRCTAYVYLERQVRKIEKLEFFQNATFQLHIRLPFLVEHGDLPNFLIFLTALSNFTHAHCTVRVGINRVENETRLNLSQKAVTIPAY